MSSAEQDVTEIALRRSKSLEDEIAKAEQRVRRLHDQQREAQKRERERNQRAVLDLLKTEKLDLIPAARWRDALPKIKDVLAQMTPPATDSKRSDG